jgi:GNAT superfamily N-acetyltransferase
MSLSGLSSVLSNDGSPAILLMKSGVVLETLPIIAARSEHRSFILSTWVKSYEGLARKLGWGEFYARHEPSVAESLWSSVAVVTDDGGYTVHGWACAIDGGLYHCYVVPELRKLRIATRLIEHTCPNGLKEYARPWPYSAHARVNPYLMGMKL